jgi:hypothetical protein
MLNTKFPMKYAGLPQNGDGDSTTPPLSNGFPTVLNRLSNTDAPTLLLLSCLPTDVLDSSVSDSVRDR